MDVPVIVEWWPVVRPVKALVAGPVRPVWLVLSAGVDGEVVVLLDGEQVGVIGKGGAAAARACTAAGPVRVLGSVGAGSVELTQVRVPFAERLPVVEASWWFDANRRVWGPVAR